MISRDDLTPILRATSSPLWSRRLAVLLVVSLGLLVVMSVLASRSLSALTEGNAWLFHSEQVRTEIGQVLQSLTDIETAERGYAATGDAHFLEPYDLAKLALPGELSQLKGNAADLRFYT